MQPPTLQSGYMFYPSSSEFVVWSMLSSSRFYVRRVFCVISQRVLNSSYFYLSTSSTSKSPRRILHPIVREIYWLYGPKARDRAVVSTVVARAAAAVAVVAAVVLMLLLALLMCCCWKALFAFTSEVINRSRETRDYFCSEPLRAGPNSCRGGVFLTCSNAGSRGGGRGGRRGVPATCCRWTSRDPNDRTGGRSMKAVTVGF